MPFASQKVDERRDQGKTRPLNSSWNHALSQPFQQCLLFPDLSREKTEHGSYSGS